MNSPNFKQLLRLVLPSLMLLTILMAGGAGQITFAGEPDISPPNVVMARFVRGDIPTDPEARAWRKAEILEIQLYRQRSVRSLDRTVNGRLTSLGPRAASLRVLYSRSELGLALTWTDPTHDVMDLEEPDAFGDAVAVEFPTQFGACQSLPHIGMGDEAHPVVLALKRAQEGDAWARQFVASGFGSLTAIDLNTDMNLSYNSDNATWTVLFIRPLEDDYLQLKQGLIPVALAIWDGAERERGSNKSLSSWKFIRLGKVTLDEAFLAYVTWGEGPTSIGDAEHGKALFLQNCMACHRGGPFQIAQPGMAPDLTNIGGYGNARYLLESMTDPSKVVVRHPNPNRHVTPAGTGDAPSATINQAFTWYMRDDDGHKVSKMPTFAHLPESDLLDIVSYLKSRKFKQMTGDK